MYLVYDFFFLLVICLYLPAYIVRRKFHQGFAMRLGFLPLQMRFDRPIWIHAVSVGEAMSLSLLVRTLHQMYPGKQLVISTVTQTGNKIAAKLKGPGDEVIYLPVDLSFIVHRVIRRVNPCACIIAETELWPNFITALSRRRVPVALVNSRISDKSYKGYRLLFGIFSRIFARITVCAAQTQADVEKLVKLGIPLERIVKTGNLKFDAVPEQTVSPQARASLYASLHIDKKDKLWVVGSTHPGEEEIVLAAYQKLVGQFPDLALVIAPRHPERGRQVADLVESAGYDPVLLSVGKVNLHNGSHARIFILDMIGRLLDYYEVADIVFVGGSLVKKGGHNILEPAAFGKPIVHGPYMFNFRDINELFGRAQASVQVSSADELCEAVSALIRDPAKAQSLGQAAQALLRENRGATERTLALIKPLIG